MSAIHLAVSLIAAWSAYQTGGITLIDGAAPPHRVWHAYVTPGDTLEIASTETAAVEIDGETIDLVDGSLTWTAPDDPGTSLLTVSRRAKPDLVVTIFRLRPSSEIKDGLLNGFRIGEYPTTSPTGFIELKSEADLDLPVSPHFTVGQFICKQQPEHWPKYVLVSSDMLVRLEALLAKLRVDGVTNAETFFVMSGFRTPFYNTAIGSARLSRHMWGDAADVWVDINPVDGVMDDLNKDGQSTKADANWLYDYAEKFFAGEADLPKGGMGSYGPNAVHGPFVHVDGRGKRARWGRW